MASFPGAHLFPVSSRWYAWFLAAIFIMFWILLGLDAAKSPRLAGVQVQVHSLVPGQQVTLPYTQQGPPITYIFTASLAYRSSQSTWLHIIPDDCIEKLQVNGALVNLSRFTDEERCNTLQGVTVDIGKYLYIGNNSLSLRVLNREGPVGLHLYGVTPYATYAGYVAIVFVVLVAFPLLLRLGFGRSDIGLWLLANSLFLYWFWRTDITYFSMDLHGHLYYAHYIAEHLRLPESQNGWLSYHPPLFYLMAGLLEAAIRYLFSFWSNDYLRILCLLLFNGFLLISLRIFQLSITSPRWRQLAALLLLAWPLGFMLASRIDSNALLYLWAAASIYFLLRWHQSLQPRLLAACLCFLALGIATRSNAYVLVPATAAVVCHALLRRQVPLTALFNRPMLAALCAFVLAVGANTGRILYYRLTQDTGQDLIIGNSESILKTGLAVGNQWEDFTSFSYWQYLDQPFFRNWQDDTDRAYFWNVLFKSAAFGEFIFKEVVAAMLLDIVMLLFWAIALLPLLFYSRRQWSERLPHVAVLFAAVAGLMYNRYAVPIGPSGDFRYIYFALVPLIFLFVSHLQDWQRRGYTLLTGCGLCVAAALPVVSVFIYLRQV